MGSPGAIEALIDELLPVLGSDGIVAGESVAARAAGIWRSDNVAAPVIFRPSTTEEVAAVLRACHRVGQTVVTHGGLTGLVEGAIARDADVVLSTERLRQVERVSAVDRTLCVQAGVTLQSAQEQAAASGLMLGLDLGARGSCTIGGNVATNAGGNQVIRYGMTRDAVLGLEVVLADGTIISALNGMLKNNTGYDLKQLFIGSEGTLGVITRINLRLRPAWRSQETALVACSTFSQVTALLNFLDESLGGTLSAFELFWQDYYELVAADNPPLVHGYHYYVLVEALGVAPESDHERFVAVLDAAAGQRLIEDASVCKSGVERQALWSLRDNVEQTLLFGPALIFDVSLPLSRMEGYVRQVQAGLAREFPEHRTWVFGHAGDGNLHFVVVPEPLADARDERSEVPAGVRERVERAVYHPLRAAGGSVSGEHGIGLEKKPWLSISRSAEEIELMRQLKRTLDPQNILNPGLIFDPADE